MTDADDGELRDVLLAHSDHQAVRNVFGAHTGQGSATLPDYVEAMRATEGAVALVASEGASEVYARWNGGGGRFEHLTIWPPWTVGGYEHTDRAGLVEFLEDKAEVRATLQDYTPFADRQVLTNLSEHVWP
jgi:hypothetical protein